MCMVGERYKKKKNYKSDIDPGTFSEKVSVLPSEPDESVTSHLTFLY